jgi:RHS repeat-associated protein
MTTTNYIWDEQNYLAESDGTNTINTVYTNEPRRYGDLISSRIGAATSYHQFDGIGSTRQLTNSAGATTDTMIYDAWGNVINRIGSTSLRLLWIGELGYYSDAEIGTFYVRARLYAASLARWTTIDPLLPGRNARIYVYAGNSPYTRSDPSGLIAWAVDESNCTVTMEYYIQLRFVPAAANDPNAGQHTWTPARKQKFAEAFPGVLEGCWSDPPFRIGPACCNCPEGWTPKLRIFLDALPPDNVASVSANAPVDPVTGKPFVQSSANPNGTSTLDEQDIYLWPDPDDPDYKQITACHEFGHMIGLTHPVNPANPNQTGYEFDLPALMGDGMELRKQYYDLWSQIAARHCHGVL